MSFVTKENTEDIYPLSPTQKGILFHSLYDNTIPVYFQQLAFRINGPLNINAFRTAWDILIDMTPVFRTVFKWAKVKKPLQIVLKELPINLNVHDIAGLDRRQQEKEIRGFLDNDRGKPFDMEEGPLMRLNLFRLGKDGHHLVWSYHHIIIDGWCLPIVLNDLFDIYMFRVSGVPLQGPDRRPYRDYIAWCLNQDKDSAQAFWKEQLCDFDTPTPLLVDRRPSQSDTIDIGEETLDFTEEITTQLQNLAKKERITQNTVIQAVWVILLSYYSDHYDVVFGSTSSGRPADLKGSEDMVGLFINTLPLRVRFAGDTTVNELLQSIQASSLAVREYEYSFLPDIKACSAIPSMQNLFDSIVVFENYPVGSLAMGLHHDFRISDIEAREMTNFPITIVTIPGTCLSIRMHYSKEWFGQETVKRMMGHMYATLCAVIKDTGIKVSDLDILTPKERDEILSSFNNTYVPYPEDRCAYQLFEDQVEKTPERVAITFEGKSLTYRELNARANQLAHYLQKRGVTRDSNVGLIMERSPDMIVGVLGVLKAGGAYVPLDPEYPEARLAYMLRDCGARLILTHSSMVDRLPPYDGETLLLDMDGEEIDSMPEVRPERVNSSRDLVYVIYTSGSTGEPKGIEIEHRGLVNYIAWAVRYYDIKGQGSFPLYTSMSFDLTVTSIFVPLAAGQTIEIQPVGLDPTTLLERVISSDRCDIAKLTPAHLEVADHLTDGMLLKSERLNRLILGGEALSAEVSRSMLKKYPGLTIYNEYGPAETVVGCIVYKFSELDPGCSNVPIGRPIANTKIYILGKGLKLLPIGVTGEIYISSPGVARGYLNKDDITAMSFLQNPFIEGDRIYRTGDLGRWLPGGDIEYLGRIDHQVKIRGYRIELGEVEATLSRHVRIRDCVVVDREETAGGKYLVGYYVSDEEILVGELRTFLNDSLPDYMVPARFMRLEALPLTPNGKVDRKALPEADGLRPEMGAAYIAPRSELEGVLAKVWQDVLSIDRVGIYDNFFELGGDSIISLQVVGRLKKEGYEIRPRDIFERQSIAELISVVGESKGVEAEQGPVVGGSSLTPVQRWFFDLGLENEDHFNQSLVFKSAVRIDEVALKKGLQALVDHHDVFRMRFINSSQENQPLGEEVFLVIRDVASQSELGDEVNKLQTSLNIAEGPVFGAGLYRMAGIDYLALAGHHLVVDGVSWRILLEDLSSGYQAAISGSEVILPAKTTSFKEWATKLLAYAKSPEVQREASYWGERLSVLMPELPLDHHLGANDIASSEVIQVVIGQDQTGHLLRGAHRAYHTEVNDLLITALMRALQSFTGQDEVIFDLEGHGREEVIEGADVSRTVGWFTTIYPVVFSISREESLAAHIRYVKEGLRSIPARGFNYGVLRYMGDEGLVQPSGSEVVFNYLGQVDNIAFGGAFGGAFEFADETDKVMAADPRNRRSHLIDINCRVEDANLLIYVAYSKNRYKDANMHSLAQSLKSEIEKVLQYCMGTEREGYTPSDFVLADISQDQLDDLVEQIQDV